MSTDGPGDTARQESPVVLVSLDGVAPRFITPESMPHLCALLRAGGGCFSARTLPPLLTRPIHASMLLGVDPATHGVGDNSAASMETGLPSLLAVARAAGRSTCHINSWRQIDTLIELDAATIRFALDAGYGPDDDATIASVAELILRAHRPDVSFVYLSGADLAGHEFRWGSTEYLDALFRLDSYLGRIVDAAGDDASILVTTDHGGTGAQHDSLDDEVMDVFIVLRSTRLRSGSMWSDASVLDVAPTVADLAGVDTHPGWQGRSLLGLEHPMVDHILGMLGEFDRYSYGENVTMLQHALQTAGEMAARLAGGEGDDELVLAALLHDIGHLVGVAGEHGHPRHAELGAAYLRPWFPAAVTEPIRLHVAAKRHLVGTSDTYAEELSGASRVTLAQQGGPFSSGESVSFLAEPHAARAILLRQCDDLGKRPDVETVPLEKFRDRIAASLEASPIDPAWARDACRCERCRDPLSDQHLLDVADLTGWTMLGSRRLDDGRQVDLVRADGDRHTARIPTLGDWADPDRTPWSEDHLPTRRHADDHGTIALDVVKHGLSLVEGIPTVDGAVLDFASKIGFVRETNYGRLFDVRVEPDPSNLAYSPRGLPLHTDNPYRDPVPTVQVLHCLQPAASGGANLLSDGIAAAGALRRLEPAAFETLACTVVRFRFHDDTVDLVAERTVIDCDPRGRIRAVALNHRSLDTPADSGYVGALSAFTRLLDRLAIEVALTAGEAIIFDNRRVLHSRTGFDPRSGRHLQGCYIDIDAIASAARLEQVRHQTERRA